MKVQILGGGCPKCRKLTEMAEAALKEAGLSAELEKVTDPERIMEFGVMVTPALAIDGEVKSSGRLPAREELVTWFREAAGR